VSHVSRSWPLPLLVALTLIVGCTTGGDQQLTVDVTPGSGAALQVDSTLRVELPAGAVDRAGRLSAQLAAAAPTPDGLRLVQPVWNLELAEADLTGTAALTWNHRPDPAAPAGALPVFLDEAHGRWVAADATTDPATGAVVATTPHFSKWTLLGWDPAVLTRWLSEQLDLIIRPPRVDPPSCPDENGAAAAGVTVASSDSDLVRWCVGRLDGATVLQVTNNRGYALSVQHPDKWTAQVLGPAQPLLDSVASGLGRLVTSTPRGRQVLILGAGQTVELTVVRGQYNEVVIEPSPPAYLASALIYGAQTFAMVMERVPGGPEVSNGKTAAALKAVLDDAGCIASFQKLQSADVSNADALSPCGRQLSSLASAACSSSG
jgi:hypothetical protein